MADREGRAGLGHRWFLLGKDTGAAARPPPPAALSLPGSCSPSPRHGTRLRCHRGPGRHMSGPGGRAGAGQAGHPAPLWAGHPKTFWPGHPEPLRAGHPEPLRAGHPEPLRAGHPEPLWAGHPEPLWAGHPEPLRAGHPEPLWAGHPEPLRAGHPEPLWAGHPEPFRAGHPEPLRAGHPEPLRSSASPAQLLPGTPGTRLTAPVSAGFAGLGCCHHPLGNLQSGQGPLLGQGTTQEQPSDEREQPLANRHQWGSIHPQRVQQRAGHLLQRLPVHPPAPSSLWCPPALQAQALPHHPAAVWERHLPRDRGAGAHPRPGARELHPHHRGVSRQAPRGHQLPAATLRHPLPQGQPAAAAAGAAALRPHGQADPGPVPGPARAAAAGRQRLLSHRLLRAAPGGGRERQEEDARQDQRERFGPRPPAPRAPQQAAVHHEPSAALQPQQRAEPPPKRAGTPPRRPAPAPALPPGGHGHGTPLPGHLPAPRPPGAPAARRCARDAAGGGDRPPAHGPGVGGGVEAPQQPAELHHGHGGEDAAVADGAAAVPGGRSRGAQPLDPALQQRRGHEERQPPLGTPPQLLLRRRRGSPVRRSPGLRAAAALRVHARGDLEEG
ncbi:protein CBFA2T3 isoform X2 [Haemorhous mexicanus]|uniref:protein CBFA2T3 isoform X1 n=1 Tax=Haemorhous mexicanus TaxID=30427 RepID=UPI0028BE3716|nr:protein CBFA2T3 isoform X1 [Haemorhous mexicanus]XP_059713511.1 protein CBFA2T3 isoform X2 [Haemorhous mexicanus]